MVTSFASASTAAPTSCGAPCSADRNEAPRLIPWGWSTRSSPLEKPLTSREGCDWFVMRDFPQKRRGRWHPQGLDDRHKHTGLPSTSQAANSTANAPERRAVGSARNWRGEGSVATLALLLAQSGRGS